MSQNLDQHQSSGPNTNEGFLNPYNFIALPSQKAKKYEDKDYHYGVIEYEITTESPLFIPNTSDDNAFFPEMDKEADNNTTKQDQQGEAEKKRHLSYDFYSWHELVPGESYKDKYYEPVIPGSEIRGMIRSIYETLTGSCMSILNIKNNSNKKNKKEDKDYTIDKLVRDFVPCRNKDECCPACDLFGMIGTGPKANEQSKGTLIRFADAKVKEEKRNKKDYYMKLVTLEPLQGPNAKTAVFYLQKPEGQDAGTYHRIENGKKLKPGEIRGRKYYWHQPDMQLRSDLKPTNLNTTIRPLKPGISFRGKLYFDGISQIQLEQLCWILSGGEPDGMSLSYKLGRGKPLGLGSVRFKLTRINERTVYMENGKIIYKENEPKESIPKYNELRFDPQCKKDFMTISDYETTRGMTITYPRTKTQMTGPMKEGYKWFQANRERIDGILHLLPSISDYRNVLPYLDDPKKEDEEDKKQKKEDSQSSKPKKDKNKGNIVFKVGETYEACITGYNPKCTSVYIIVNHQKGSMYFKDIGAKGGEVNKDPRFPVDKILSVRFLKQTEVNGRTFYNFAPADE